MHDKSAPPTGSDHLKKTLGSREKAVPINDNASHPTRPPQSLGSLIGGTVAITVGFGSVYVLAYNAARAPAPIRPLCQALQDGLIFVATPMSNSPIKEVEVSEIGPLVTDGILLVPVLTLGFVSVAVILYYSFRIWWQRYVTTNLDAKV